MSEGQAGALKITPALEDAVACVLRESGLLKPGCAQPEAAAAHSLAWDILQAVRAQQLAG